MALEPERSGHAAAAGLNGLDIGASFSQKGDFARGSAEDRLVMTMAVNQNALACEGVRNGVRSVLHEEVREQPCLVAKPLRDRVVREKLLQLVAEDAGAAWLKKDERQAGNDLRGHALENLGEIVTGRAEEAEVVERTPAADVALRAFNAEA